MASSEPDASAKAPKTLAVPQEQPLATSSSPTTTVYPDWSGFQALSPIPPHGFFHSPVASSPQAHPYMWGAQHFMPPYGSTPAPYVMYPHGGLYGHPSFPSGSHPFSPCARPSPNGNIVAFGAVPDGTEGDDESSEGKERSPIKGFKGSLGSLNMITGKNDNDRGNASAAANDVFSQSGESGTECSSEGSDTNSQQDMQPKMSEGQKCSDAMASQNGATSRGSLNGVAQAPRQAASNHTMPQMLMPGGVAGPTTNLSIGMDYWGTPTPSPIPPVHGKVLPTTVAGARASGGPSERLMKDERELRRERRKQSNRESARRSRLRKQAECEELAQRVEALKEENAALKAELDLIKKDYEEQVAQNASLKEKLKEMPKGMEETRPDVNQQNSGDETEMHLGSDAQAGQTDTTESGH